MSTLLRPYLAVLFLSSSLVASASTTPAAANATIAAPVFAQSQPYTSAINPETVRVSLVSGDVRISRGKAGEKATGDVWEQAVADLPLESGFSLVTGKGRAEIEFEDASTVYLAENSVLVFNDLSTTGGVPHTEMTLLSGTATLNLHPDIPGELFNVTTPAENIRVGYGQEAHLRLDSYLDALGVTPLGKDAILDQRFGRSRSVVQGQTVAYSGGRRVANATRTPAEVAAAAEWDQWVSDRVSSRNAAMEAMVKQSGLDGPIAGMADMQDQGNFFSCAPYGTCWVPNDAHAASQQPVDPAQTTQALPAGQSRLLLRTEYDDPFPCIPLQLRRRVIGRDPVTGKDRVLSTEYLQGGQPYNWAVCHAGTWINRQNRYVWVAGRRRHHHCPVHWVKNGRTTGYVPIHPHDVKGKPPINLKYGLYTSDRKAGGIDRIAFDTGRPVKLLAAAPREFRKDYYAPLNRAETPHLEARVLHETLPGTKSPLLMNHTPATISFDHKSQSFTLARQVSEGNRTVAHVESFGGRVGGSSFSGGHSSFSGGGGNSGGHSSSGGGGGSSHASSGGGSSGGGGGGSHSSGGGGGSSGGGGGGSHK